MLQLPLPPAPPAPPSIPAPDVIIGNTETLIITLVMAGVVFGLVALGPIGRAIGDAIRHIFGVRRSAESRELDELREQVAAFRQRVAELEERQDFAERLLAQVRERAQLPGPPRT